MSLISSCCHRNVNESSWNIDEVSVGNGHYSCENGFIEIDSNEKVCVGGCDWKGQRSNWFVISWEASDTSHQPMTLCVTLLKRRGRFLEIPVCVLKEEAVMAKHSVVSSGSERCLVGWSEC